MNCTRSLRSAVVRTCLISVGLSLAADFVPQAAMAAVKCPTGQAYSALTKRCGTAPTAATTPGAVKRKSAGGAVRQPTSSTIPNLSNGKLPPTPPNISSINPPGGQAGTTVTIDGTGFAAGATVSVGDAQLGMAQATNVTLVSPKQITAVLPPGRSLSTNTATTVNVQVTVAGQTSKAVLFSYCSNVTEYDPARKICVPLGPTCGANCPHSCPSPLVFSTAQNKCVPAAPVVCTSGQIYSAQQNQCIPGPPVPLAPVDLQPPNGAVGVSNNPNLYFRDAGAGTPAAIGQFEYWLTQNNVLIDSPPLTGPGSTASPVPPRG
jgi:hypothetical protein